MAAFPRLKLAPALHPAASTSHWITCVWVRPEHLLSHHQNPYVTVLCAIYVTVLCAIYVTVLCAIYAMFGLQLKASWCVRSRATGTG
jgi:hypothetical protein